MSTTRTALVRPTTIPKTLWDTACPGLRRSLIDVAKVKELCARLAEPGAKIEAPFVWRTL